MNSKDITELQKKWFESEKQVQALIAEYERNERKERQWKSLVSA